MGESTKIIGIGYKKNSGKNSFAKFLTTHIHCTEPKLKVKEVSFALKVKDIAFQLYSWANLKRAIYYETHYSDKEIVLPELGLSPRDIWIGVGNKMREIYPGTWIEYALNSIKEDVIIITDLGFGNEARSIRDRNGILIKLHRDGIPRGTDARETELDSWPGWDFVIENNGSLDDLYKKAVALWNLIR